MANYTEGYIKAALPEGFTATNNWATGVIEIKAPDGTTKKFQNTSNMWNINKYSSWDETAHWYDPDTGYQQGKSGTAFQSKEEGGEEAYYLYNDNVMSAIDTWVNGKIKESGGTYTYSMTQHSYLDAAGNPLGTNDIAQAATNAQANAAAAAAAAEAQRKANVVSDMNAANALIEQVLGSTVAPSAKQNFTITAEDYAALRAKYPEFSDEQLTKMIVDAGWANNFGATLSADKTTSALKGATLEEFIATANEGIDAAKLKTNAEINKQRNALLKQIENDPELYNAVVNQLRGDTANGVIAGQRAANLKNIAQESNANYKASADKLYELIGGTGEDSLAGQMRSSMYGNLTGAYGGYTEQQLNNLARDMNLQTKDVQDLITALSLINQGLKSEDAAVRRAAEDEAARIINEARDRESKASQQSASSIAGSESSVDGLNNLMSNANSIANNAGVGLDANAVAAAATSHTPTNYGTGTYNKPDYEDAPYIDETLYKTLLGEDYTKFLSQDVFDLFTRKLSEEELAKQYGLEDLLNVDSVVNKYTGFQKEANAESDKVFNDAQRAYITAIAAGDVKTADQLARMAQSASISRKNLQGASALANQFAQQRANANVSNNLYYDTQQQQAANKSAMANATQAGRTQWNQWVGDGNPNASGNGFSKSYAQHVGNAADAKSAYGDIISGAVSNQSSFNDTVGQLNRDSNNTLSGYAAALNQFNAQGAKSNTTQSAAIAAIKNNAEIQKLINNAVIANNS